ncbi:MAG: hypothetical protein RDU01_04210 [Thermodesulfovibrionales bacterium]|nr:hypothetical protein [Thermodesulfovibrionales bacterium]
MNSVLRIRKLAMLLIVVLGITAFGAVSAVSAQETGTVKDTVSKEYKETKDICPAVKQVLKNGLDTKETVKSSIELGHDACLVVRCAIEGGGNIEQVIVGALAAGATSDVCSRCAIQAGASPAEVAKALETGLGYSPPLAAGLPSIEIGLPGDARGGGVISPATF